MIVLANIQFSPFTLLRYSFSSISRDSGSTSTSDYLLFKTTTFRHYICDRIINAVAIVTTMISFSVSAIMILSPDKDPAARVGYGGFRYLIVGIIFIVGIPRLGLGQTKVTGKP